MSNNSIITFSEAREVAQKALKDILINWADLNAGEDICFLSDHYMESEGCWFFFRHDNIFISPDKGPADSAVAVSKRGEVRLIADFRATPEMANKYLKFMSEYFIKSNL
jgi:30S ribosomal protein S13